MTITITGKITQTGKSILSPPSTAIGDRAVLTGGWEGVTDLNYITMSSLGNSIFFGTSTAASGSDATMSNSVRGALGNPATTVASFTSIIQYITISTLGNAESFGETTLAFMQRAGCSNGTNDRGLMAGGRITENIIQNIIDWITISSLSNASDFGDLSSVRDQYQGVSNGVNDLGVFAAGRWNYTGHITRTDIDTVNISSEGNASVLGNLSMERRGYGAVSNDTNDVVVWAGGVQDNAGSRNVIDYKTITTGGTASDFGDLDTPRQSLGGASTGVDDRGTFSGAYISGVSHNIIDYITITSPGSTSDFGDLLNAVSNVTAVTNAAA